MNRLQLLSIFALSAISVSLNASDLEIPNSFTAGTPAIAAQVNANFTAVETAVDDNHAQIETLQTQVQQLQTENQTLQSTISTLESTIEELQSAQVSSIASVTSPRLLEENYTDFELQNNKGVFTIQFNIAMDTSTFIVGDSVTISGSGGSGTGTIQWLHGNSTMVFTTTENFIAISPCFSGGLDLTIKGNGENPVTDLHSKPLDGDKNGLPGGDFVVNYDIVC